MRAALAVVLAAAPLHVALAAPDSPREQVFAAERAFAAAMADRSLSAFAAHVADEAIFFTGAVPLRGKYEVVSGWARFFETAAAPFSWEPDQVEVLQSGNLALSTGLVRGWAASTPCGARRRLECGGWSSTKAARRSPMTRAGRHA